MSIEYSKLNEPSLWLTHGYFPCDLPVGKLEALGNGKIIRLKKPMSLNDHEEGCLPTRNIALVFALARKIYWVKMLRFEGVVTRTSVTLL